MLLPHTHCTPERRANLVTVGPRRRTEAQTGNGELAIKHRRHSRFNPVGRHSPNCSNRVICPFWHATKMRLFSFNLWSSVSSCCAPGLAPWTRPACARGSMWVTKYRGVRRFDLLTLVYMYTAVSYVKVRSPARSAGGGASERRGAQRRGARTFPPRAERGLRTFTTAERAS